MTDRELLELAAKAAGHKIYKKESKRDGILIFKEGRQQFLEEDGSPISSWNPLTDDGDALRLAVSIGANIDIGTVDVQVETRYSGVSCEPFRPKRPRSEAVRRAIVHSAAAIGKGMP